MNEHEINITLLSRIALDLHDTCIKYVWDQSGKNYWNSVLHNIITELVQTINDIDWHYESECE